MWASVVFYWEYFWTALYLTVTVYFGQLYTWVEIAYWVVLNCYSARALLKADRQRNGWDDPGLMTTSL